MGIKIIDAKVVGLCSKCRKEGDEIIKNKHGDIISDSDIACLQDAFGNCKGKGKNLEVCQKIEEVEKLIREFKKLTILNFEDFHRLLQIHEQLLDHLYFLDNQKETWLERKKRVVTPDA